ncbi:MAG: 3-ketoacyl-ACP reductase [Lewinellaceae bacterium]|nr:3-ketoacyl-ACP reductase [Lewinella sp.]MCB9280210.1 3-ketoacyl-ACP reductase [Lewinellaceae bacterium]
MTDPSNKTALITGGSRGIGLGIARRLASEGWNLAINGMRPEPEVAETMSELKATGIETLYCRGDIGNPDDRAAVIHRVMDRFGRLNALVNNAGVAPKQRLDLLETTEDSFDRVLNINLKGAFFLSQSAANIMAEAKRRDKTFEAYIVNVSSVSATVASVNRGEYCISKAGLAMVTQLFAARLGEFDIPVYEVRPGVISTDMTSGVREKYDRLIADGLSVQQRWGEPGDVGKAVAALLRGDFLFSTGQIIMVDGGMTLQRL